MDKLVPPHGGVLSPLMVQGKDSIQAVTADCQGLYRVAMNSREVSDLIMLGNGAYSPLKGFMVSRDYQSVLRNMRLDSGTLWPIPVTLAVSKEQSEEINEGQAIALFDGDSNKLVARMVVLEKHAYDKRKEARSVFGTDDENHPGVAKLYGQKEVYLGGPVEVLSEGDYPDIYSEYATPSETRRIFNEKGWSTVTAFQTRNPLHMSHEYLIRIAMEISDGVLIHPIVGKLKEGDIPGEVRMKCYHALVENYLPVDRVVLKVYPMEMRYGGPREAVLHAIIRQNFGCSHLVIGRDHAGVGDYYGPFDAQDIFNDLMTDDLAINPLKLAMSFWCYRCKSIATEKTCSHGREHHLMISGTEFREMLLEEKIPPEEFSRPEVIEILTDYYRNLRKEKKE